jgi:hypothetical protein
MTDIERLSLDTSAGLMESIAAFLTSDAGKIELLSVHLPGISQEVRDNLAWHSQSQLKNARQLKENAAQLRLVVEQNQ